MDLREAIRTTGSVREFRDEAVADALVASVLDDARFAPSGGNRQPWRVALVKDAAIRRQLAALMQPVWDEYVAASRTGAAPFNAVDYRPPAQRMHASNSLLDGIERVPAVLAVAADLRRISAMDAALDRISVVPGASIYPFCWNVLLAARDRGLGGVLTTFLSRVEREAAPLLKLPEHHALAATIFLGYPVHQPTRLRRKPVEEFASVDAFEGVPLA
ncbi:MAG TPA: nitroreductase family protein [Ilumatobacter sp.]|jgi:nitroreductase|nr:nitroreductase family protein [Ilumatobacter sp.]